MLLSCSATVRKSLGTSPGFISNTVLLAEHTHTHYQVENDTHRMPKGLSEVLRVRKGVRRDFTCLPQTWLFYKCLFLKVKGSYFLFRLKLGYDSKLKLAIAQKQKVQK